MNVYWEIYRIFNSRYSYNLSTFPQKKKESVWICILLFSEEQRVTGNQKVELEHFIVQPCIGQEQCVGFDQNAFYLQQKRRDLGVGDAESLQSLKRPPLLHACD